MINWKVRLKNPHFWVQVALAAITPVFGYFGIQAEALTSWNMLFGTLVSALTNPYVCLIAAVSIYNAVIDPTTAGVSDSLRALGYTAPYKKEREDGKNSA